MESIGAAGWVPPVLAGSAAAATGAFGTRSAAVSRSSGLASTTTAVPRATGWAPAVPRGEPPARAPPSRGSSGPKDPPHVRLAKEAFGLSGARARDLDAALAAAAGGGAPVIAPGATVGTAAATRTSGPAAEAASLRTGDDAAAFFFRQGPACPVKFVHLVRVAPDDAYDLAVVPADAALACDGGYAIMSLAGVVSMPPAALGQRRGTSSGTTGGAGGAAGASGADAGGSLAVSLPWRSTRTTARDEGPLASQSQASGAPASAVPATVEPAEFIPLGQWLRHRSMYRLLRSLPFFALARERKAFRVWAANVRFARFAAQRAAVAKTLVSWRPAFVAARAELGRVRDDLSHVAFLRFGPPGAAAGADVGSAGGSGGGGGAAVTAAGALGAGGKSNSTGDGAGGFAIAPAGATGGGPGIGSAARVGATGRRGSVGAGACTRFTLPAFAEAQAEARQQATQAAERLIAQLQAALERLCVDVTRRTRADDGGGGGSGGPPASGTARAGATGRAGRAQSMTAAKADAAARAAALRAAQYEESRLGAFVRLCDVVVVGALSAAVATQVGALLGELTEPTPARAAAGLFATAVAFADGADAAGSASKGDAPPTTRAEPSAASPSPVAAHDPSTSRTAATARATSAARPRSGVHSGGVAPLRFEPPAADVLTTVDAAVADAVRAASGAPRLLHARVFREYVADLPSVGGTGGSGAVTAAGLLALSAPFAAAKAAIDAKLLADFGAAATYSGRALEPLRLIHRHGRALAAAAAKSATAGGVGASLAIRSGSAASASGGGRATSSRTSSSLDSGSGSAPASAIADEPTTPPVAAVARESAPAGGAPPPTDTPSSAGRPRVLSSQPSLSGDDEALTQTTGRVQLPDAATPLHRAAGGGAVPTPVGRRSSVNATRDDASAAAAAKAGSRAPFAAPPPASALAMPLPIASSAPALQALQRELARARAWAAALDRLRLQHVEGAVFVDARPLRAALEPVTTAAATAARRALSTLAHDAGVALSRALAARSDVLASRPVGVEAAALHAVAITAMRDRDGDAAAREAAVVEDMHRAMQANDIRVASEDAVILDDLRAAVAAHAIAAHGASTWAHGKLEDARTQLGAAATDAAATAGKLLSELKAASAANVPTERGSAAGGSLDDNPTTPPAGAPAAGAAPAAALLLADASARPADAIAAADAAGSRLAALLAADAAHVAWRELVGSGSGVSGDGGAGGPAAPLRDVVAAAQAALQHRVSLWRAIRDGEEGGRRGPAVTEPDVAAAMRAFGDEDGIVARVRATWAAHSGAALTVDVPASAQQAQTEGALA